MNYSVLGPMEVIGATGDITPTAPKLRQVLALLLLRHHSLVQTGEFIDELWGDYPPRSALSTLQTYVYKLRRVLFDEPRDGEERLITKPSGYLLRIPSTDVDLGRFETLADEGALALENREPQQAAAALSAALSLWRGPALADVTVGGLLSAYATRLEESRMRALELRIEADLQLGRHHRVIGELKMLTTTHRLHEGFHAKLMLALYRSGRRYEALNVYRRLREVLVEELGLEPSAELNRMHQALLSADPSLDAATRDPLRGLDGAAIIRRRVEVPPAPPPRPPADVDDFVGRREELQRIERWLLGVDAGGLAGGVVSISGMPGAGKTTLAVRAAHALRGHFPDGQLLASLGGGEDTPRRPEEVLGAVLSAIGVPGEQIPDRLDERSALLHQWTASKQALIVLDDAVSMAQLEPFLPPNPGTAVIVTSRLPLAPGGRVINLGPLCPEEGLRLLENAAGPNRAPLDRAMACRVVSACGGLPLALRAAGCRLAASPKLSLDELDAILDNHRTPLDLLRFGPLDVRARYHSSYNRLAERDRYALRLLSLYRQDTFTAAHVAPLLGMPTDATEMLLACLAEHHLLRTSRGPTNGAVYYRIHELTRQYARERLEEAIDPDGLPDADDRPLAGLDVAEPAWSGVG
jgi:DNA-binding SARP family transcriptional activator